MAINDVVSPIIQSFIAGQNQKRGRERDKLAAKEAEGEAKLREQRAQLLQKEIDNWDKVNDSRMTANFVENKAKLVRAVQDGIIPVKAVEEFSAELSGNEPNVPGAIGISSAIKHYADVNGQQIEVPSPEQVTAQQVKNQEAFMKPKLAFEQQKQDIKDTSVMKIQDRSFKHADATREDVQANANMQAELNRAQQDKLAKRREDAQASLAKFQANEAMRRTNVQTNASIGMNNARIAANKEDKTAVVKAHIEDIMTKTVKPGLVTRNGLIGLGPDMRKAIETQAKLSGFKLLTDKEEADAQGITKINGILEKMDRVTRAIGNGEATGFIPGTELYQDYQTLTAELGGLARSHGNVGSQSDKDIARAEGLIMDRVGQNVQKKNREKMEALKRSQIQLFEHYYPKGLDPIHRIMNAERFGLSAKDIAVKEK